MLYMLDYKSEQPCPMDLHHSHHNHHKAVMGPRASIYSLYIDGICTHALLWTMMMSLLLFPPACLEFQSRADCRPVS